MLQLMTEPPSLSLSRLHDQQWAAAISISFHQKLCSKCNYHKVHRWILSDEHKCHGRPCGCLRCGGSSTNRSCVHSKT